MKVGDEVYYLCASNHPIQQIMIIKVKLIRDKITCWLVEYLDHFEGERVTVGVEYLYENKTDVKNAAINFVNIQSGIWKRELDHAIGGLSKSKSRI